MTTSVEVTAPSEDDRAWDRHDVAAHLRIGIRRLSDLRKDDPTFPQPRMVGRKPIWARRSVTEWVEQPSLAAAATERPARRKAAQRVL
jgi:predicted DNA-binding transcriptional regulator AlpA